jgi:hypothetical protein
MIKDEPTLVTRDNSAEFVHRHALEQWQQLLAFLDSCGSELLGQLMGNLSRMEIFQVKRIAQMVQNYRARHIEDLGK